MERATKRRIASMIGISVLAMSSACAHRPTAVGAGDRATSSETGGAGPTANAGGESSIFRLEASGTFSVRFNVPTPSPVAERILVAAELEMCDGARGRYKDYGETPLLTAALAERLALSGLRNSDVTVSRSR